MPHPNWTHTCTKTGRTRTDVQPFRCWRCFGRAEFSGWGSSVVEMMGGYQREHGLKCMGPHRRLADEVFKGAFTRCDSCSGSGYLDDAAHLAWSVCEACDGFGRRPAVSEEDIERRRAIVLAAFPDAARPLGRRSAIGAGEQAGVRASAAWPVASEPMPSSRSRAVVSTESPDLWDLLRATLFVLVLAPGWLFGSIWAFRGGQAYAGSALLFASVFAALSGLMTAAPSAFDRRWLWVWGASGVALLLLLGFGAVQAACAG